MIHIYVYNASVYIMTLILLKRDNNGKKHIKIGGWVLVAHTKVVCYKMTHGHS
jgi:hypothetical protein